MIIMGFLPSLSERWPPKKENAAFETWCTAHRSGINAVFIPRSEALRSRKASVELPRAKTTRILK